MLLVSLELAEVQDYDVLLRLQLQNASCCNWVYNLRNDDGRSIHTGTTTNSLMPDTGSRHAIDAPSRVSSIDVGRGVGPVEFARTTVSRCIHASQLGCRVSCGRWTVRCQDRQHQ